MSIVDGRYVITQDGCPHCKTWKEKHGSLGLKEKNLSKMSEKDSWWTLLDNLGVDGTPSVIEIKNGRACEVNVNNPEGSATLKCASVHSGVEKPGTMAELIKKTIS